MMNQDSEHIDGRSTVRLRDILRGDIGRAGAKAANLGELMGAGFPVPDGFVVTTEAFGEFLKANALDASSSREQVEGAPLPPGIAEAVLAAAADLGEGPLAVRSSGVAEDLPGFSFAGQYETVLNVRSDDTLLEALRHCWASAFSERVLAYRNAQGQQDAAGMAVLVQRMVAADAAGVAFTANPVTGNRSETVVSAVKGLGERLVSGQASPDEWLVKNDEATCHSAPEGAIETDQARAIAEMARRVEAHYGSPQDIEWASSNGQLFLLQARPITALPDEAPEPIPVAADPPPGFWQREVSHAPQPVSPMMRTVYHDIRNRGARQAFREYSFLMDGIEFREIGGWEYMRILPFGGKDRPPPPPWLVPILARLAPSMRSRIKGCVEAVRTDRFGQFIRRWYDEWKPEHIAGIATFRQVDLPGLSDAALDDHIAALMPFFAESTLRHFTLHPAIAVQLAALAFAVRDLLGWGDNQFLELMNGLSERSSEPARRLADLAGMAKRRPAVRALLGNLDKGTAGRLADADPEFASAFDDYQREFGCRALQYTLRDPTVAESPTLVLSLIRDQLVRDFDPVAVGAALEERREAAVATARTALAARPEADRERFERALASAELAYPVREDNEFYTISAPIALIRYALLELAGRLVVRGQMAARDELFFLELEEARSALRNGESVRDVVARRRAERAWVEAHPGPATYGVDPGPPPSLRGLPKEVQFGMEGFLWVMDRAFAMGQGEQAAADGSALHGIPASAGRYTGPVRVIMNENEFGKLQPGDVLVCPVTSPVWSVLFPSVGALVTDAGGTLSHPAIIAREYRVPAVVAAGSATSVLQDDQVVTVDGSKGVVEMAALPERPEAGLPGRR